MLIWPMYCAGLQQMRLSASLPNCFLPRVYLSIEGLTKFRLFYSQTGTCGRWCEILCPTQAGHYRQNARLLVSSCFIPLAGRQ